MKILIIEDEFNLADAIRSRLQDEKYVVDIEIDGKHGLETALSNNYDLIILDVMLPQVNGYEILKEVKSINMECKIIMLTAKTSISDKLNGFNLGADDYLTKPFHMDELVARVNVLLKMNNSDRYILSYGNTEFNLKEFKLINIETKQSIEVIGKESQLLGMLLNNKSSIISKEAIFNKIWGICSESNLNCVEAYISFLRKKLKMIKSNISIKSIRNTGYKLELLDEKDEK